MEITRYPDPAIEVVDPRFASIRIGNAAIERLWSGGRWLEGPVWCGDNRSLLFSDIPNDRILRWDESSGLVSLFRHPSNYSNGNSRDRVGRLVTCEHGSRRVTRTEYDGQITTLADSYQGRRLNAPNDLVVASDHAIWFTDPGYGIMSDYEGGKAEFELPTCVYRLDAKTGQLSVMVDDMERPNGLCFSPDERLLYVVDTGRAQHIRVFEVIDGARIGAGRVFVEMAPGGGDGIRTDCSANLWAAAAWGDAGFDGVHCYAPDGALIGRIHLPEGCSNLCFGGLHKNRLFMTASQSLYSVYLNTTGAQWP